jgi:hypothetical protein
MSGSPLDPVALAQRLIRCRSVTPADDGAIAVLEEALTAQGFACTRIVGSTPGMPDIQNLWARYGGGGRHFCFAGHTDVVPPGELARWRADPFAAEILDGHLIGRGAVDMKGAIAAFAAASAGFIAEYPDFGGSISLLITGDEEGPSVNGTIKVLDRLVAQGQIPDACLVGEPTNERVLGDTIKVGRRHRALPALEPADFDDRYRQPGDQRHPGARARLLQRPLQRFVDEPERRTMAARPVRSFRRLLYARHADQRRVLSDTALRAGGTGGGRRRARDRAAPGAHHRRRYLRCALHSSPLSGGRIRAGRADHAQARRGGITR